MSWSIDPPLAQSAPDPHDEENMDARPDQEETEKATNKFLQLLEKQEKKGHPTVTVTVAQACTGLHVLIMILFLVLGPARQLVGVVCVQKLNAFLNCKFIQTRIFHR